MLAPPLHRASKLGTPSIDGGQFTILYPKCVKFKWISATTRSPPGSLDSYWTVPGESMVAAQRGGKRVGYVRVSSVDQNTVRQLDGVTVDKTFTDRASGKDTNRPQLKAAMEYLRDGDVLVCHSMDRLARNISDLLQTVDLLNRCGVVVEFVKEALVFTGDDSAISKLMLTIMGGVAEFERAMIRERQLEGIAKAKQAGKYRGRQSTMTPDQLQVIRQRAASGEKKASLAREFGVSRQTIYNLLVHSATQPKPARC